MIAQEIAIRHCTVVTVTPSPSLKRSSRSRRIIRALIVGLMAYVLFSIVLARLIDGPLACVRDPEYAARRDRLLAMQAKHPGKPIVLAIGSSRMVEGFRPDVFHENNPSPDDVYLNGGLVGSGSMLELLSYRRLKRDGLKPSHVLIEYWPPLLRGDNHAEYGRIDLPRLSPFDWPLVRDYFPDPSSVRRYVAEGQIAPAWRYRRGLIAMIDRRMVPNSDHHNRFAKGVDDYGWWPGVRDDDAEIERTKHGDIRKSAFTPYLQDFSIGEPADRALRDLIQECHADGVNITLVFLPENKAFQTLYTDMSNTFWRQHVDSIVSDTRVSFINARDWDFEIELPDGVHLTRGGASRFTQMLINAWRSHPRPESLRQPKR